MNKTKEEQTREIEKMFDDADPLMKEKNCIKFTGYIFLPKGNTTSLTWIKRLVNYPRTGRLEIFNEYNKKKGGNMVTFGNFQELADELEEEFKKRAKKIMKNWK